MRRGVNNLPAPVLPVFQLLHQGLGQRPVQTGCAAGIPGAAHNGQTCAHKGPHRIVQFRHRRKNAVAIAELAGRICHGLGHILLGELLVIRPAQLGEHGAGRGQQLPAGLAAGIDGGQRHGAGLAAGIGRVFEAGGQPFHGIQHFGHANAAVAVAVQQTHGALVELDACGRATEGTPEFGVEFAQPAQFGHGAQGRLIGAAHAAAMPGKIMCFVRHDSAFWRMDCSAQRAGAGLPHEGALAVTCLAGPHLRGAYIRQNEKMETAFSGQGAELRISALPPGPAAPLHPPGSSWPHRPAGRRPGEENAG